MKRKTIAKPLLLGLAALLCAASAGAQVYKWTDAKGVVHFSDTPPASVKAEIITYSAADSAAALPYELAQAARANPVLLYTSAPCAPCDQARSFLQRRGIPYAEKTVSTSDDQQQLKDAGSDNQLPLLLVGRTKLLGFASGAWNEALSAAGYPSQAVLPRGYQFAAATPAAPRKPSPSELASAQAAESAAKAAAEAEEKAKFAPRPPPINGTPDFQF